jgi:flavin-binding protein dodecin
MPATTRVVNKMGSFNRSNEQAMERALARMRQDIFVLSQFKVPEKDGTLRRTGKQSVIARLHHRIAYGENGAEDYAGYQHRGMRADGSHRVKNYTKAGSQKNYLSESGGIIATKASSYFMQEATKARA